MVEQETTLSYNNTHLELLIKQLLGGRTYEQNCNLGLWMKWPHVSYVFTLALRGQTLVPDVKSSISFLHCELRCTQRTVYTPSSSNILYTTS